MSRESEVDCGEGRRLEVRRAAPGDEGTIREILDGVKGWLAERGIAQWTIPFTAAWIAERVASDEFHIASVGGKPVATLRLLLADPLFWGDREQGDAVYVHTMAVRRDRAGEGIGAAMLRWAEDEARGRGRRYLRLDCAAENRALGAYYQGLGFVPVGTVAVGGETMMLFEQALTGEGEA